MELTEEMMAAVSLIADTNDHVFVTGKAGTGKTTLLRYLTEHLNKAIVVTASTGIAAVNAGGMTLHSLFYIPAHFLGPDDQPRFQVKMERRQLWQQIETIIIDEISMVRPDVLDFIDRLLRFWKKADIPFGGAQLVMFGDLFQLPPVVNRYETDVFAEFYDGPYFFYANTFAEKGFHVVELNHVFRQSEQQFVDVLNRIRDYSAGDADFDFLSETYDAAVCNDMEQKYIHLCALKRDAQSINDKMLGNDTVCFDAELTGEFSEQMFAGNVKLKLRVGARVMMLVNDPKHRYCNGSLGTVTNITNESVMVRLDEGNIIVDVARYTWLNNEYITVDEKVYDDEGILLKIETRITVEERGSCKQFPLIPAWATTIHKSQGLTFDKIAIHARYTFCPGQMYVALSRCRTIEGIVTDTMIKKRHIIPDSRLVAFERQYRLTKFYQNEDKQN